MSEASDGASGHDLRQVLDVIFVVDGSGSMSGERIGSLNWAARAALPGMRDAAAEHPGVTLRLRVCRFGDTAEWPVARPTLIGEFVWTTVVAGGESAMGAALASVGAALAAHEEGLATDLPPVVLLLSDGMPTDDARAGLAVLLAAPRGSRAIRIPIAIGSDADMQILQEFIGHQDRKPFRANDAETLAALFVWAVSQGEEPAQPEVEADKADAEGLVW